MKILEDYFEKNGYEQIYINDINSCKNKLKDTATKYSVI